MTFTADEFTARLDALRATLAARGVDLAILTYPTDLYYYTGSVQPLYLLAPVQGEACVLARKAVSRIEDEVTHLPLYPFSGSKDVQAILEKTGVSAAKVLGLTLDTLPYATAQRLLKLFPEAHPLDLSWDIRTLRMVKSPSEIAILAAAGAMMASLPQLVQGFFEPGMTELQLSAALEYTMRLQGHDALVRCRREGVEMSGCGVCAAGANTIAGTKFEGISGGAGLSPAVPFGATHDEIEEGKPILLDFAFVLQGYHLDQTRIACWGEPSEEFIKAYRAMLYVEQAIFDALRPGASWESIWQLTESMVAEMGYADTFMGSGREQVKFVGHGVGLELDEPPFLAPKMPDTLQAGMTLAIEPKVALPGLGVIGIEDTVVIRDTGITRLTTCPQDIIRLG